MKKVWCRVWKRVLVILEEGSRGAWDVERVLTGEDGGQKGRRNDANPASWGIRQPTRRC